MRLLLFGPYGSVCVVGTKSFNPRRFEMASKTNTQAEKAYIQAHQQACDLLAHIEELLHDLPAPGNEESPIHWAHVGTATEVVARLTSVVTFLSGNEN